MVRGTGEKGWEEVLGRRAERRYWGEGLVGGIWEKGWEGVLGRRAGKGY